MSQVRASVEPGELLAGHRLITTDHLDEARDRVARVFCPHRLSLRERGQRLSLRHNRVIHESIGLNYIDYGAAVHITPGVLQSFFLVQIPLRGGSEVRSGSQVVQSHVGEATVPSATEHLDMTWEQDSPHFVVYLSRESVERRAAAMIGSGSPIPVRFRLGMPLHGPEAKAWLELVHLLRRDAEGADVSLHPVVRGQLEDAIVAGLLTLQPSNLSEPILRPALPAASRAVRAAMEHCDASPGEVMTVAEMARVAGVSVRSLQEGFRRYVGLSPTEYLREVRLRRVREELLAPQASGRTVAEVAYSWGFTHLGRFAGLYRARFGEHPSQTLRGRADRPSDRRSGPAG